MKLNSIPRNIRQAVSSLDAIETVESDSFAQCIIDAYAYMVWPYMGLMHQEKHTQVMSRRGGMLTAHRTGSTR